MVDDYQCVTPIEVTARLAGPVCLPSGYVALDAILTYQAALRLGKLALDASHCSEMPDIPIAMSDCGAFYLSSFSTGTPVAHETQYTNRRPIIAEAQMLAEPKCKRIDISVGANKGYRIPRQVTHYENDELRWWAVGDRDGIADLLAGVSHLGKRRGVGLGRVREWRVEPCESWGEGFPVVRDGKPLRTLPVDHAAASGARSGYGTLLPPYWDRQLEELCLLPS